MTALAARSAQLAIGAISKVGYLIPRAADFHSNPNPPATRHSAVTTRKVQS